MTYPRLNPVALPKPDKAATAAAAAAGASHTSYYEGNVPLMEARFLELSSSIRALYRSVEELRDFCKDPETADEADHVVVEAMFENLGLLRKQRKELVTIVASMNRLNAHTDVPDDIRIMVLGDPDQKAVGGDVDGGFYL